MENVNQNQSTSSKMTVGEVVKGVLSSMCYLIGGTGAVITVFVLLTHGRYITDLTEGELSLMDIQTMGIMILLTILSFLIVAVGLLINLFNR